MAGERLQTICHKYERSDFFRIFYISASSWNVYSIKYRQLLLLRHSVLSSLCSYWTKKTLKIKWVIRWNRYFADENEAGTRRVCGARRIAANEAVPRKAQVAADTKCVTIYTQCVIALVKIKKQEWKNFPTHYRLFFFYNFHDFFQSMYINWIFIIIIIEIFTRPTMFWTMKFHIDSFPLNRDNGTARTICGSNVSGDGLKNWRINSGQREGAYQVGRLAARR